MVHMVANCNTLEPGFAHTLEIRKLVYYNPDTLFYALIFTVYVELALIHYLVYEHQCMVTIIMFFVFAAVSHC